MERKEPGTRPRGSAESCDGSGQVESMKGFLFTDGGARLNPGLAGIGVALLDDRGGVIGEIARPIGTATNNVAEYMALIEGLSLALDKGVTDVDIQVDSPVVVGHLLKNHKVKSAILLSLVEEVKALLERFECHNLRRESRTENVQADRLANAGMDASTASMFTIHLDLPGESASATCARCLEQSGTRLTSKDPNGASLWDWMVGHTSQPHPS